MSGTPDFLIAGAGIIGLSVAREVKKRHRAARVVVVEKEARVGTHASGRNSGVLHAGFYYTPDSLKARFTRVGNARLTEYCLERKLPIRQCGKLVIATSADELTRLDELHRRGVANGVTLAMVSADEAHAIEPRARVFERAIWSPTTSTVDPLAVMESLLRDCASEGIEVRFGAPWSRTMQSGFFVNAAGLHADVIARAHGLAEHYVILPFKGRYVYASEPREAMRTHIYPVPDPRFPFLGVHFTVAVDGSLKIGPTAAPALWREQYGAFENFRFGELAGVATRGLRLLASDAALRRHALAELRRTRRAMVADAARLATGIRGDQYTHWGKPGIRAQLYDTRRKTLEMDFVIERGERSLHILNAVSPGFTCAMPFAEHVCDEMERQ